MFVFHLPLLPEMVMSIGDYEVIEQMLVRPPLGLVHATASAEVRGCVCDRARGPRVPCRRC